MIVRCGVDDRLDDLKESYAGLESKLVSEPESFIARQGCTQSLKYRIPVFQEHLARKLSTETPFGFAPDFSIVYFPQVRSLFFIYLQFLERKGFNTFGLFV